MAQQSYPGDDPHFTQGLFSGSIIVIGGVQLDLIPPPREAQVLVKDARISDSLRFYSCASFNRLQRVQISHCSLQNSFISAGLSQLTTVVLTISRWNKLGAPAAAAGKASEAWLAGPDAIQRALEGLQQQPKQLYLLKNSSRATAGRLRGKRADASSQQAHVQGGRQEQLSQEQQEATGVSNERPYQQQEPQQPSQQGNQHLTAPLQGVQSSAEQQVPYSMPFPGPYLLQYHMQRHSPQFTARQQVQRHKVHVSPGPLHKNTTLLLATTHPGSIPTPMAIHLLLLGPGAGQCNQTGDYRGELRVLQGPGDILRQCRRLSCCFQQQKRRHGFRT